MDLLRELKAMPVTLNLLQVGLGAPPAWDSSRVPGRACWPLPRGLGWYKRLSWRTPSVPLSVAQEDKGAPKDNPPCFSLMLLGSSWDRSPQKGYPLHKLVPVPCPMGAVEGL